MNILFFFYFSTFRPLGGRYKWSLLQNIFQFFDFSTSFWDVKLIDFTGYIGLFWLFDFLTYFWEVKMIDFTEYIEFSRLLSILMNILIFFDFSTFRSLGVWSKWSIWLNILYFFDDLGVGGKNDQFHWLCFDFFRLFDLRPLNGR